nr:hypothetical protein [Frigoribacterium sp. PhB160]
MVEDATEHNVDLQRREAGAGGGDVAEGVVLADDGHGTDRILDASVARQHGDGMHLGRGESDVGEERLGVVGEICHVRQVVGHVGLASEDAAASDRDLLPRLRVDDVDTRGADDDEVDLGTAATAARPGAVGEERVADRGERGEDAGDAALGDTGEAVARGGVARLGCRTLVGLGKCLLAKRFLARGCSCCGHVFPPWSGRVWSGRGL